MPWKWLSPERDVPVPDGDWRKLLKRRATVALTCCALWAAAVEARLVQLQVFQHEALADRAEQQQQSVLKVTGPRGDIVDRAGRVLAYSVGAQAIAADPSEVKEPAETAARLCAVLTDCTAKEQAELATRLTAKKSHFTYVRRSRSVSPAQAERVAELKLHGVMLVSESRRYYPNFDLAAHVLGFVGNDDAGLGGVEKLYDDAIKGREGITLVQFDARHDRLQTVVREAPQSGATLELTIDLALQHIVERELRAAVEEHHARGGTAVIMNPETGEILALANAPTFNPNAYGRSPEEDRRNRAIQEIYEPGSTFKIVTASAAIEEGVINPSDLVDCNPGYINVAGRRIPDTHPHGILSFEDVVVFSSNVGAIKVGLRVGAERLSRYVRRFGFGEAPSSLFFPGASRGIVFDELSESALASVSMGYQIGVTPLQMVTAASAVANGGELMEPHIVRAVVQDGVRTEVEPKILRRAIAPTTAAVLTTIMEGVVERGTAKKARLDRYQVAGKTGTAEKLVDGRYSNTEHNASFVGFVPSRRPEITILVVIDSPHNGLHFGGDVAAPVFKRIAEAALQHLGVPPSINARPPVVVAETPSELPELPPLPVRPATHNVVPVVLPVEAPAALPDVTGLGLREAVRALTAAGLSVRPVGSGVVAIQTPAAGTTLERGAVVRLELRRTPSAPATPAGAGR